MLRITTIRTKLECITFKPEEEENSFYPTEKKKKISESKKISNVDFLEIENIHCVVMIYSGWSEIELRHSTELRSQGSQLSHCWRWENFILLWDFCFGEFPPSILFVKPYNLWGIRKLIDFIREGYMESRIFRRVPGLN